MGENSISDERLYFVDTQKVDLSDLELKGRILDIGGGGEGIIGQLFKGQVVSIDPNKRELIEAPEGPLKLVMDARDLKFLDSSFENITSFFTLMYIPTGEHEIVLKEIYRVLKPEGELYLWDVAIPEKKELEKDFYVIPLEVKMKDKIVKTGYGTKWEGRIQNHIYFTELCEKIGFKLIVSKTEGEIFKLILKKERK